MFQIYVEIYSHYQVVVKTSISCSTLDFCSILSDFSGFHMYAVKVLERSLRSHVQRSVWFPFDYCDCCNGKINRADFYQLQAKLFSNLPSTASLTLQCQLVINNQLLLI